MEKNINNIKSNAGITIITLVVTILIIIILASITINAVLGDNGLLKQAQDAKDLAESTTLETGDKMNSLLQEYMNVMAEDDGGVEEPTTPKPFEPGPTPEPPTGGTEISSMVNGVIEIKWLEGTSDKSSEKLNANL